MKTRGRSGFTLIEVVIALAILAIVTVMLLDRRIEIVRSAGKSRDMRTAWALAAQKLGELENDPLTFAGEGGGSSGDFRDVSEDYAGFQWEYDLRKEDVATNDPKIPEEKPKQIFHMKLTLRTPAADSEEDLIVLEALYPVPKEEKGPAPK